METPIQIIIKKYRGLNKTFNTLDDAAKDFLQYLRDFGDGVGDEVKSRCFDLLTGYPLEQVNRRLKEKLDAWSPLSGKPRPDFDQTLDEFLDLYISVFKSAPSASFLKSNKVDEIFSKVLESDVAEGVSDKYLAKTAEMMKLFLKSAFASQSSTGFIIAGFARNELFPSLRSFEIDGMVAGNLRYMNWKNCDIEHNGPRARIVPFAQQAMVDRFVSGIDASSQREIERFCRDRLIGLHADLMDILEFEDGDTKKKLSDVLREAEQEFIKGLQDEGFGELKKASSKDMEDMVEFMPKTELAQMAESLVELTSIKRRVSKGFETVGGPIDVAVLSRSEGFVWIKRKHYFPPELNARFYARVDAAVQEGQKHGRDVEAKPARSSGRRPPKGGGGAGSGGKAKG